MKPDQLTLDSGTLVLCMSPYSVLFSRSLILMSFRDGEVQMSEDQSGAKVEWIETGVQQISTCSSLVQLVNKVSSMFPGDWIQSLTVFFLISGMNSLISILLPSGVVGPSDGKNWMDPT